MFVYSAHTECHLMCRLKKFFFLLKNEVPFKIFIYIVLSVK
jgi:hypothetical protein